MQAEATSPAGFAAVTGSAPAEKIARLRKQNTELHRRCQQAEAAVAEMKREWDKHGGPRGGSFGRALLACECVRLTAAIEETLAENAHLADGDNCTLIRLKRALGVQSDRHQR